MTSKFVQMFTNNTFIAANAHCWFACVAVIAMVRLGHLPVFLTWLLALALAAAKEFWFDAHYETPPQSLSDNMEDFLGYVVGIAIGLLMLWWGV